MLRDAIAPSVVTAIRREIANSREMMVDALYPITGRMVSAAVANAIKDLLAFLEQRINALTSSELWIGRIKSAVTGRPISEFVLAGGEGLRIQRLLMIERGSGRLVAGWKREGTEDDRADLLSAMVAAILEFSVQALAGEGDLQKLDFGGREIMLRASPRFIFATEYLGSLRPADEARINSIFFDRVESMENGQECDTEALAALAAAIENGTRPKKPAKRGKVILFAVLAVILAAIAIEAGIWSMHALLERRTYAALDKLIEANIVPDAFPLQLHFDHGAMTFTISGVEPDGTDMSKIADALADAAAPYRLINRVGIVSSTAQSEAMRAEIAALRETVARLEAEMQAGTGASESEAGK